MISLQLLGSTELVRRGTWSMQIERQQDHIVEKSYRREQLDPRKCSTRAPTCQIRLLYLERRQRRWRGSSELEASADRHEGTHLELEGLT